MRRILVENARRKQRIRHGGQLERCELEASQLAAPEVEENLLELDGALDRLAEQDAEAAEVVKLRFFAGLTIPQTAEIMGISPRKADFLWSFARAWLRREIEGSK
jgi:RNA polymerase sigma factor (TIGR02999 family)